MQHTRLPGLILAFVGLVILLLLFDRMMKLDQQNLCEQGLVECPS